MRTTLDLPDDLVKSAKIAAVRRGMTLRALVARAVARDLAEADAPAPPVRQIRFPIFHPSVDARPLTAEDVRADDLDEDRRLGALIA